jgi:hypothetical protein
MHRLHRSAISPLLAADRSRIFALDHYLEMRERLVRARTECEHLSENILKAGSADARRRAGEMCRAYQVAESDFLAAESDLQSYHRALDLGSFVRVGYIARVEEAPHSQSFAFINDGPIAWNSGSMRVLSTGDWLRIWDCERACPLAMGTIGSTPWGEPSIAGRPLGLLAKCFDGCFPAEFAGGYI